MCAAIAEGVCVAQRLTGLCLVPSRPEFCPIRTLAGPKQAVTCWLQHCPISGGSTTRAAKTGAANDCNLYPGYYRCHTGSIIDTEQL
jgi:hypothetical protein